MTSQNTKKGPRGRHSHKRNERMFDNLIQYLKDGETMYFFEQKGEKIESRKYFRIES